MADKTNQTKKKINKTPWIGGGLLLLGNILFFFALWLLNEYDAVYLDQVVFQMKSSLQGVNSGLVSDAVFEVLLYSILLTGAEVSLYLLLGGHFKKLAEKWKNYAAYCKSKVAHSFNHLALPAGIAMVTFSIVTFVIILKLPTYLGAAVSHSDFIEQNYVDPNKVEITFPETKRNLIYIYLESMENTVAQPEAGGNITQNFIPELTDLAEQNVSFSNTEGLGGAMPFFGTTWTSGAMISHSCGVPLKTPLHAPEYGGEGGFMPGITNLGDILEKEGYQQVYIIGSDGNFGGRADFFEEHGNFTVLDINALKEANRLPADYHQWWGFEDDKLFSFAQEELMRLSKEGQPFNLTLLTCDTHFPNGYLCEDCGNEHEQSYSNVYSCSSKKVAAFIEWAKTQPFYENTTIVLAGDHLTMDPEYMKGLDSNYVRTTYNCFINAAVEPGKTTNRTFATFDLFPSTLAAMGVKIEGDRLGLGTNLFSSKKTLAEEYGYKELDYELLKESPFYSKTFLKTKY